MGKKIKINGRKVVNLTGHKFGLLTALQIDHKEPSGTAYWLFKCDCGNMKVLSAKHIKRDGIRSCGCVEVKKPQMSLKDRTVKNKMSKRRDRQKANKRKFREENLSTKNAFGFTDLTPYNAISGKQTLSKPTLTDVRHEVSGGFNTAKK